MKTIAILQARRGSSRLPDKVLADVAGRPLLSWVIDRAKRIPGLDEVWLATSEAAADGELLDLAEREGIRGFAGSEVDVLDRYYMVAREAGSDIIMRLTGDCPLLDPAVSGLVLARFLEGDVDYAANIHPPTYPDGLDTEVFSFAALERSWRDASSVFEREHVTAHIWSSSGEFRTANVKNDRDLSDLRWTVDLPEDLSFIREIYHRLSPEDRPGSPFGQILSIIEEDPGLQEVNKGIERNEGSRLDAGDGAEG